MSDELKDKNNPKPASSETDSAKQRQPETPPPIVTPPPATPTIESKSPKKEEGHNRPKNFLEKLWEFRKPKRINDFAKKWKHAIEFAGLAGLLFYCAINAGELWVFNSERQDMDAEFHSGQTNAVAQYDIAHKQLDQNKLANQIDERAWVFVTIPDNAFSTGTNSGTVATIIKNVGKTAALINTFYSGLTVNPATIPTNDPPGTAYNFMIIPQTEKTINMVIPIGYEAAIYNNSSVYCFGTVYYSDIFNNRHWCQFCFSFHNNGLTMTPENFHSACDDLNQIQTH